MVLCGDAAGEDEAVRKSTAFQVRDGARLVCGNQTAAEQATFLFGPTPLQTWLLGYEFPSTILLIQKDKITFVSSATKSTSLAFWPFGVSSR